MAILGINTATGTTEVVLIESGKVLFKKAWKSNRDEAEKVIPTIHQALRVLAKKSSLTLEKILIIQGPGPFTGLRVGINIANTLAFVKKVPLITCDTFTYFSEKIPAKFQNSIAIILKAGGEYVAIAKPNAKPKIMALSEVKNHLLEPTKKLTLKYIVGDIPALDRKKIPLPTSIQWFPEKSLLPFSHLVIELASKKMTHHKIVKPKYLRPPKITQSKKALFT